MVGQQFEMNYLWFIFNQVISLLHIYVYIKSLFLCRIGRQEPFRSEINHEESPIESLKVSHTKFVNIKFLNFKYFLVIFFLLGII